MPLSLPPHVPLPKPSPHLLRSLSNAAATAQRKPREEHDEHEFPDQPITNRPYWSQKLHSLSLSSPSAALGLLDRLRPLGYRPSPLDLSTLLHSLLSNPPSLISLRRIFLLLASHPSFIPSLTLSNRFLAHLCTLSRPQDALHFLRIMKSNGRSPNSISYTTLINGFSRIGKLDDAYKLFDEMSQRGIPPNSLTYSVLITGVLRKRLLDEAKELMKKLWSRMAETNDNPSVKNAAFANLVDSLCREGMFHEVFGIAEEMPQKKWVPEIFAYGQMIDSFCRVGKHHMASRIVYIMRKRGFVPSLVSYNCIVHGLSKDRGCMRAYQLFKEGIEFGYVPSEVTYKVLVETLCQEMDVGKAKDVMEFMVRREGGDKTRVYNIFLSALRLVENPSEQLNVLVAMLQKQCRPDVVTLNTVVHGFCKIGKVVEARRILDDMLKGSFCAPDVVTFTTMIRGLLDVGRSEEALNLLHRTMAECSCTPNVVTYNAVLHGLFKLKKVDEAMEIFNEMVGKGIGADSKTYTVIVEGLCDDGRLEEVKKFWDDVIWPWKTHDDYVYAAILRGLCRSGKVDSACDFLYELVDCGLAPGIVNYNILIDNACKLGLKKEAYRIVGEMRKNGLKPDAVTWRILDKLHEKKSKECGSSDQGSETKGGLEGETTSVKLEDKIGHVVNEEKEYSSENRGVEGLTDPCSKTESLEEDSVSLEHNSADDEKEYSRVKGRFQDPLEGLIDPHFSTETLEEDSIGVEHSSPEKIGLDEDSSEKSLKPEQREPLSRIARRVFGLPQES